MSIAQSLPEVEPFFMQACHFCGRANRMVVKGVYRKDESSPIENYPDMGYSFCNCKNVFYTRLENVLEDRVHYYEPKDGVVSGPDPFFAWPNPYDFMLWDVRRYLTIWPMDALCEHLESRGYEIISAERDFDVHSKTPQHFHIKVKK